MFFWRNDLSVILVVPLKESHGSHTSNSPQHDIVLRPVSQTCTKLPEAAWNLL